MSMTIDYATVEPVQVAIYQKMNADTDQLLNTYDWWAEPMTISYEKKSKRVDGSARIFLGSYTTDNGKTLVRVTEAEDYLLACNDGRKIIKQLESWSESYSVSWKVDVSGEPLGNIVKGKTDKEIYDFINWYCEKSQLPESSIPELLKKFESRKEPIPPKLSQAKKSWWNFW